MPLLQKSLQFLLLRCLVLLGVLIGVSAPAIAATATERDAFAAAFREAMNDPALYDDLIEGHGAC